MALKAILQNQISNKFLKKTATHVVFVVYEKGRKEERTGEINNTTKVKSVQNHVLGKTIHLL